MDNSRAVNTVIAFSGFLGLLQGENWENNFFFQKYQSRPGSQRKQSGYKLDSQKWRI